MTDHLLIAEESTKGTFNTPGSTAHSGLQEWSTTAGETRLVRRASGRSRAPVAHRLGTHMPSGSATILVEPDNNIVSILKSLGMTTLTTSTPSGGTNSRDHVLQMDDAAEALGLSMQAQQIRNDTTEAQNVRGADVSQISLSVSTDDFLRMAIEFLAVEIQEPGVNFGDGESSPAAVGSISYNTLEDAFQFADMTIIRGGTVSQDGTSKVYTISGGTTLADVESLELTITLGKEQRPVLASRYSAEIIKGNMEITGSLTVRNDTPDAAYFTKLRAGTQEALQIKWSGAQIESGFNAEFEVTIPLIDYNDTDAYGALSSDNGARSLTIPFTGILYATTGDAVAARLRNDTASY